MRQSSVLVWIIVLFMGPVIAIVFKLVHPNRTNMGWVTTILIGMVGGYVFATGSKILDVVSSPLVGLGAGIVADAIPVAIYASFKRRKRFAQPMSPQNVQPGALPKSQQSVTSHKEVATARNVNTQEVAQTAPAARSYCGGCGRELVGARVFCKYCGANASEANGFCSACGAGASPGAAYCTKCGNMLRKA